MRGLRVPAGIGLGRLLAAVVERHHDVDGIIWPMALAPYDAAIVTTGTEVALVELAERVVAQVADAGFDVLYDDRDVRAGVKFKDADLIGIPIRIAIGARAQSTGAVEWKQRGSREVESVPIEALSTRLQALSR